MTRTTTRIGLWVVRTLSIVSIVLTAIGAAPTLAATNGLVGAWLGDGNALDSAGTDNGTLQGGVSYGAGVSGQAFQFNGSNASVDLGNGSALRVSSGDFTVDAWVNFAALSGNVSVAGGDMSIVDKISSTGVNIDGWRLIKQKDNLFWFCLGGGGANGCDPSAPTTVMSKTAATVGAWTHVAGVKSASGISIYVNGVLEASKPLPTFTDTNSADMRIGSSNIFGGDAYLNGRVDDVYLYNRALSASELQAAYAQGTGPISWWKADGNTLDSVGPENGNTQGGLTYVSGVHGQAFNFNGTDAAVSLPMTQLPTYPNPWSIGSWITTTSVDPISTARYAFFSANDQNPYGSIVSLGEQFGNLMTTQGGDNVNGGFIADGAPHYVAVTFDGSTHRLYVDGQLTGAKSMAIASTSATSAYIGRSYAACDAANSACHWDGMIDDLKLYNRALSQSDIQSLAANGLPTPTGPVAMWKGEGNVKDSIGSDNGTAEGALTYGAGVSGQDFVLDGSTAAGLIGNPLNTRTQTFTVDGWIKRASAAAASNNETLGPCGVILMYGQNGYGFCVLDDGRTALTKVGVNNVDSGSLRVTDTNWHHVAVTKSGSTVTFYVDGVAAAAPAYDPGFVFNSDLAIGERWDTRSNSFLGQIDELEFYNRALAASDIQALYQKYTPTTTSLPALAPIDGTQAGFPATPYPYASAAVTVNPYPPTQGQSVTLGAFLQNPTASAVTLTSVDFAISGYGLGLSWQPVGSVANVTIPAATTVNGKNTPGTVHPTIQWTPPFSGHHCVQVTLHYADGHTQVVQRNIDILGISSGGPATTTFQVGNPTASQATISLKLVPVAQSPQGWTATLGQTSIALAPNAFTNLNLTITPPAGAPAGSYATYNVEGYIGSTLIGGISKTVVIGGLPAPTVSNLVSGGYIPGRFTITGTALPYAHILCHEGSVVFETWADGSGNWSLPIILSGGSYSLLITQEVGGSYSPPAGGAGGIAINVGVQPVGGFAIQGVPAGGATNVNVLHFGGTGVPGDTVVVDSTDPVTLQTTQIGSVIVGPDGAWNLTSGAQPDCDPTFTAIEIDGSGTQSAPTSGYTITIDTRAPTITIGGVQQGGVYTNSVTPTITIVDLNAKGGTAHVSGVDASRTSTTLDGQPYTSGTPVTTVGNHTLVVTATDRAGNVATQTVQFTVEHTTALSLTSSPALPTGGVVLSAKLIDTGTPTTNPLSGQMVSFTVGGSTVIATTGANGVATAKLDLQPGQYTVDASFAGAPNSFLPSSAPAQTLYVYQPTQFVIWGANQPTLADTVKLGRDYNFWGAQWFKQVQAGDYQAGGSFKGYADQVSGSTWTSNPGNSSKPPASIGNFVGVIVATHIDKSGSTIAGDIAEIVVLKVDNPSAYQPDPGHAGTGVAVAILP